jgi:hypothetical protein
MRVSRIKKGESRERCAERNRANDSVITNRGKAVTAIEQTQPFLVNLELNAAVVGFVWVAWETVLG